MNRALPVIFLIHPRKRNVCVTPPTTPEDQEVRFSNKSATEKICEAFTHTANRLRGSLPYDKEYSLPRNSFWKNIWKSGLTASRVASRFRVTRRSLMNTSISDRKSTRLNSSRSQISYAVFCLKKKNKIKSDARVYIEH